MTALLLWYVLVAIMSGCSSQSALRARLIKGQGTPYLAARSEALALSDEQFASLSLPLSASGASPAEHIIGHALSLRRRDPRVSREFDDRVAFALANPDRGSITGAARYDVLSLKLQDHSFDPLLFEAALKRDDLPPSLRWNLVPPLDAEGWGYPEALEPCIGLINADGAPQVMLACLIAQLAVAYPDDRVYAVMLQVYKNQRRLHSRVQVSRDVLADFTARLGSAAALKTIIAMKSMERSDLIKAGYAPRDDVMKERAKFARDILVLDRMRHWDNLCAKQDMLEAQIRQSATPPSK